MIYDSEIYLSPAVQIYDLSYIHLHSSPSTVILRSHNVNQVPDGLIAQLLEHCICIAEVMGWVRIPFRPELFFFFFQAFIRSFF